jgi:tetratricopeptide (TPR) repeat protein
MKKIFILFTMLYSHSLNSQTDSLDFAIENLKRIVSNNSITQGMYGVEIRIYHSGFVIDTGGEKIQVLFSSTWKFNKKIGDYPRLWIFDYEKNVHHGYSLEFHNKYKEFAKAKYNKKDSLMLFITNLYLASRHQILLPKNHSDSLTDFRIKSDEFPYDSATFKMNEEHRKLLIQGEFLYKKREYLGALDKFLELIDVNPLGCPEQYSYTAFTYEALEQYDAAIYYMSKFLIRYPNSRFAVNAQNKIYEWELLLPKND